MGDRDEREEEQRKQYYGYTHKELAALPEWERDAIVRRRIEEDVRGWGKEKAKQDSPKSEKPSEKKDDCFVANVVYGGEDIEQLRVLREYRDNVLMQDEIGKRFVDWYYGGGGEKMAEFVSGKGKFLIPIIRRGLDFIVEDYKRRRI